MAAAPRNPFQFGRALGADELVDRDAELALIERSVTGQGRLFLIGPRRFGKTSLLHAAAERLERKGIVVLRHDAEAYETLGLLAQAILTDAARRLAGPLDQAGGRIRKFFGALRPEVSYDFDDQRLAVALGGAARHATELPVLSQVLDGIDRFARDRKAAVAVMLDEFQQVVLEGGPTAERQLRAAVQQHKNLAYIFSGSRTRLLAEMTGDPGRPFWRLGERHFLGPIPRADFRDSLRRGFVRAGFEVEPAALDHLLDRAEDVPYNVQRLASACWELLRTARVPRLDAELVDAALRGVVTGEHPIYMQLWGSLTRAQKKALKAVVEESGRALLGRRVLERHAIAASSMQRALEVLETRGIVRQDDDPGGARYRLEDPFVAAWLATVQAG